QAFPARNLRHLLVCVMVDFPVVMLNTRILPLFGRGGHVLPGLADLSSEPELLSCIVQRVHRAPRRKASCLDKAIMAIAATFPLAAETFSPDRSCTYPKECGQLRSRPTSRRRMLIWSSPCARC